MPARWALEQDRAIVAIPATLSALEKLLVQDSSQSARLKDISKLIQQKLATMLANVTTMQLLCLRLAQLQTEGKMTEGMASLAKMHNARMAREVVAEAREMLGGNGILLEYHIARHHADIEAVFTYEGTDTIQSLIVGREITGIQAIAPPRGGG
jgi:glutaryl-CoA dehydrogenase